MENVYNVNRLNESSILIDVIKINVYIRKYIFLKRYMIIAIYKLNNKLYKTSNLEKKLKKLKETPEIIYQEEFSGDLKEVDLRLDKIINSILNKEETIEYNDIKLYYFINKKSKEIVSSIYNNLDNLKGIICIDDYEIIRLN